MGEAHSLIMFFDREPRDKAVNAYELVSGGGYKEILEIKK